MVRNFALASGRQVSSAPRGMVRMAVSNRARGYACTACQHCGCSWRISLTSARLRYSKTLFGSA